MFVMMTPLSSCKNDDDDGDVGDDDDVANVARVHPRVGPCEWFHARVTCLNATGAHLNDDEFYEVYTDQMMQALKAAIKERDKGKVSNEHAPQVSFDRLIWSQSGQDQILPIVVKPLSQSWYLLPRAATNLFTGQD